MKKKTVSLISLSLALAMTTNVFAFDYEFITSEEGMQPSYNSRHVLEYDIRFSRRANAFLKHNTDGTFTRLENVDGNMFVENYTSNYEYIDTKQMPLELPRFGGVYFDGDYTYMSFGQDNYKENDDREVIRTVKYDKDWNPVDSLSIYGSYIVEPYNLSTFDAEKLGDEILFRTGHKMYKKDDGINHQANMTYSLDTNTMELTGIVTDFNGAWNAYVSHSFAQYITTNGEELFTADLGDAYPRAITLYRGKHLINDTAYRHILYDIPGNKGQNDTGINLGGFEHTSVTSGSALRMAEKYDTLIVAGRMVDDGSLDMVNERNIFVGVTKVNYNNTDNADMEGNQIIKITNHPRSAGIKTTTPKLVKVSDEKLFVLWHEYMDNINEITEVKFVEINNLGEMTSDIMTQDGLLSDVDPVVVGDKLVWYATKESAPVFYELDTNNYTVSANQAIGVTHNYEPIEVEYEPEQDKDEVAPEITDITTETTTNSAIVSFTSDEAGTYSYEINGEVVDGFDLVAGKNMINLDDLMSGTGYVITVTVVDASGNEKVFEIPFTTDAEDDNTGGGNSNGGGGSSSGGGGSSSSSSSSRDKEEEKTEVEVEGVSDVTVVLKKDADMIKYIDITSDQKYFFPDYPADRMSIITALSKIFDISAVIDEDSFKDTQNLNDEDMNILNLFVSAGIIQGYEDGTFRPNNVITRAEFITILSRLLDMETTEEKGKFTDISEHWAKETIEYFARYGYINGYPDGTFKPDEYVSNAEVVVILNRVTGADDRYTNMNDELVEFFDVPEEHWARDEIMKAVNVK